MNYQQFDTAKRLRGEVAEKEKLIPKIKDFLEKAKNKNDFAIIIMGCSNVSFEEISIPISSAMAASVLKDALMEAQEYLEKLESQFNNL